jgi:hypothetical protein
MMKAKAQIIRKESRRIMMKMEIKMVTEMKTGRKKS